MRNELDRMIPPRQFFFLMLAIFPAFEEWLRTIFFFKVISMVI